MTDDLQLLLQETVEMSKSIRLLDQLATVICPGGLDTQKELLEMLVVRDVECASILRAKNEALICAVLDKHLRNGRLNHLYHSEPVSFEREARLPCGNADRIIQYADGTLTVVEVKSAGSRRDHAQGIGQVLLYTSAVRATRNTKDVRGMLVVGGEYDEWIESACRQAGIEYLVITNLETDIEVKVAMAWLQGKELCGSA